MKNLIVNNINDLTNTLKTMKKLNKSDDLNIINEHNENDSQNENEENVYFDNSLLEDNSNSNGNKIIETNRNPNDEYINYKLDHLSNILTENVNNKFNKLSEEHDTESEEIEQDIIINGMGGLSDAKNDLNNPDDEDTYVVESFEQTYVVNKTISPSESNYINVKNDHVNYNNERNENKDSILENINIENMNLNDSASIKSTSSSMSGISSVGIGETTSSNTSSSSSLNMHSNTNSNIITSMNNNNNIINTRHTGGLSAKSNLNTELYYPSSLSRTRAGNTPNSNSDSHSQITNQGMSYFLFSFLIFNLQF